MSPKVLNGSWRGSCPFIDRQKSIWNLLGKGIGRRHFRHLIRRDILFYGLFHYAVNMLSMLLKCQFINSGLISIRQSNRMFCLLLLCFVLSTVDCKPTAGTHYINGRDCFITTCRAGEEAIPCQEDRTADRCQPCPPDKYMEQDNVTSDMKLRCYTVHDICMPDTQRLMQTGTESASNPPKCVCDTSRHYYQYANDPDDCREKKCPSSKQLLLNGTCVCREGRVTNSKGECIWPRIGTSDPATTVSTVISNTSDAQSPLTTRPSTTADVTTNTFHTTTTDGTVQLGSESTTVANTLNPKTVENDRDGSGDPTVLIVVLIILIFVGALVGFAVYKCIIKRSANPGNPLVINGNVHHLQVGKHNKIHENDYNSLPETENTSESEGE